MAEQTLEQILEENDDDFLNELGIPDHLQNPSEAIDSSDIGSFSTQMKHTQEDKKISKQKEYIPPLKPANGSEPNDPILLPQPLSRISQALASPKIRGEVGYPTCIAVDRYVLVGTGHGAVLVFDQQQQLKQKLGNVEDHGDNCDPVTAVAIAPEKDWVAVGHQSGHIMLWDMEGATLIKTLSDIHAQPIVHLHFLHEYSQIISGDIAGHVCRSTLLYRLMYYSVDTVKVLGGGSGVIYSLAVLPRLNVSRPIDQLNLIAVTSPKATFVITLSPQMKVSFKLPRPESVEDGKQLPYLAWRPTANARTDPLLAVAWGPFIQLIQVKTSTPSAPDQLPSLEFVSFGTPYKAAGIIVAMHWIGPGALGYLNQKDELVVLDPFTSEELEVLNVRAMELVYHTRFSPKGMENNAALCSYHNSMRSHAQKIYLLGIEVIYCTAVMTWAQRVDVMEREGRWTAALEMCIEFFQGKGHAVVDLPPRQREELTGNRVEAILRKKIPEIFHALKTDDASTATRDATIQALGTLAIRSLVATKRLSMLFEVVYPMYQEEGYGTVFLELLAPCIMNDELTSLSPNIMQQLVDHFRGIGRLKEVEQCIIHLDIASLDFHQVVKLCRQEKLTRALIYMYNSGLRDYLTPFHDLISMSSDDKLSPEERAAIKKHLVDYFAACLKGKAYHTDDLPLEEVPWIKAEALGFVFDTDQNRESTEQWPRVHFFVHLDTKRFFVILEDAFDDPLFSAANLQDLLNERDKPSWVQFKAVTIDHQVLLECLYECMIDQSGPTFAVPSTSQSEWPFSVSQQGALLCFMAKYFAKGTISLSDSQLQRILGYLTLTQDPATLSHREKVLYNLLRTCSPSRYDKDKILLLAEGAKMSQVTELFYLRSKNYRKALEGYLSDSSRSSHVFGFLQSLMGNPYVIPEEKEQIKTAALDHLTELVEIDSGGTSSLVIEYFTGEHGNVWQRLKKHPRLQYSYLKTIMSSSGTMDELMSRKGIEITSDMHETYIKLMCQFEPAKVYHYLLLNTNYRLDYCLSICQHYDILDASTYLLERTGDVAGALDMILQRSDQNVVNITTLCNQPEKQEEMQAEATLLDRTTRVAVTLCQRNSTSLPEEENQALWFRLLDSLVIPLHRLKTKRNRKRGIRAMNLQLQPNVPQLQPEEATSGVGLATRMLTECLTNILQNMMGFVPIRAIMEKIVRDHSSAYFEDFKPIILAMMETNQYESNILETAKRLFDADHFAAHRDFQHHMARGFRSTQHTSCGFCQQRVHLTGVGPAAEVILFSCDHAFHQLCLPVDVQHCPLCGGFADQLPPPEVDVELQSNQERLQLYLLRANHFTSRTKRGLRFVP